MNIPDSSLPALTRLIEAGVEKSAEKLAAMSRTRWIMQTVSVNASPGRSLSSALSDNAQPHYGAYFTMPDGLILVLISDSSGKKIVDAYLGADAEKMRGVPHLEEQVLIEICNVLVNTVAAEFADTGNVGFLMSSPEITRGTKRGLYESILKEFPGLDQDLAVTSYVHMTSTSLSTDCSIYILLNEKLTNRLINILEETP